MLQEVDVLLWFADLPEDAIELIGTAEEWAISKIDSVKNLLTPAPY